MTFEAANTQGRFRILSAAADIAVLPPCICSLLIVKVMALAVNGSQYFFERARVRSNFANHSLLFAVVGLSLALLAILDRGIRLASALGTGYALARYAVFIIGFVVVVSAISVEATQASRVSLLTEVHSRVGAWFAARMRHPDDVVWPPLLFLVSLLIWPTLFVMAFPKTYGPFAVLLYAGIMWATTVPITNFEHGDSHYHFFRTHCATGYWERILFRILDAYVTYILPLALARIPNWYEVQHVVIHHAEDNGPHDTQSTLKYDRASFIDFARCATKFTLSSIFSIDVIGYLRSHRRPRALWKLLGGIWVFYAYIIVLAVLNWKCALTILLFRYVIGIISATGFFQEHGIVDTSDPDNIYTNSLHFIASDNTHGSRGEDFHIAHHLRPSRHWTEYEADVAADMRRYAIEGAVGFLDGPDHVAVYYRLLWKRDFASLAKYFVAMGNQQLTAVEMAELLHRRTRPVTDNLRPLYRLDVLVGRVAGYLVP